MGRLRIVAGELGGRRIEAPPGRSARPTREKVREAWFSALGPDVAGLRVVDLFAGSGALGLEALSRGAAHVHFVESDGRAAAVIAANVEALGVEGRAEIVRRRVGDFLGGAAAEEEGSLRFDLALADPPYDSGWPARLVERMRRAPFAGLLCVEHAPGELDDVADAAWRRRYGDTELTFVRAAGGEDGSPRDDGRRGGGGTGGSPPDERRPRGEPGESSREGAPET